MNDKYNSEHNLKSKFDSHQFSFDEQAFEKFKLELEKKRNKKKPFWWIGLGLLLTVLFAVGITSVYSPLGININNLETSKISLKDKVQVSKSTVQAVKPILDTKDILDKAKSENIQKNDSSKSTSKTLKSNTTYNYKNKTEKDIHPSKYTTINAEKRIGSFSQNSITTNASEKDLFFSVLKKEEITMSNQIELMKPLNNSVNNERKLTMINYARLQNPNDLGRLERMQEYRPEIPADAVKPYVKPFNKYFYFNLRAGMIINDNFGSYDPYLSILKSKEFAISAALAFQFNPDYAFELSYTRQTFSFGYYMKDTYELRKLGGKVNIVRGALVSKLWSPFQGLQLNMTNGLSIMTNSNLYFSKGTSGFDTPDFISKALLTRANINTSWHYMYSGGLQIDFSLSKNVACSLASEYSLGFKQLSESQLTYIEGEGVNKSVEAFSNGSFYSFTLGVKYRFE